MLLTCIERYKISQFFLTLLVTDQDLDLIYFILEVLIIFFPNCPYQALNLEYIQLLSAKATTFIGPPLKTDIVHGMFVLMYVWSKIIPLYLLLNLIFKILKNNFFKTKCFVEISSAIDKCFLIHLNFVNNLQMFNGVNWPGQLW